MQNNQKNSPMVATGGPSRPVVIQQATGEERQPGKESRHHEVAAPKPKGRTATETVNIQSWKLSFKRKNEFNKIGTWNVRSMYQGKLDIVKKEMEANNCDIVGISELKWTDKGYFRSEDFTVYYSGHESNRTRGVAIICNKMVANAVLGFNPLNDRIMTLRIQCKPINVTIVQVHAPTTAAEETEIEEFYEQLQEVTESIPSQDIVIIMGDFNAKVGSREEKPITGKFGLGDRNTSGDMLVDFCAANAFMYNEHYVQAAQQKTLKI
ncbi:craniofacial development protein 2-like [Penaeus japonicus]|uniref:craniofacial development protein 2-like n=1 Tax=Penaeus japonicus TaxID=27405 RepID=UPI001C70DB5B|nr:craniofacial development protein 2-like [Penaeus japonicus]XP_042878745.1 craniofacial development protein 2-like [Penaeus japonicus]